jgi:hypothetical protein
VTDDPCDLPAGPLDDDAYVERARAGLRHYSAAVMGPPEAQHAAALALLLVAAGRTAVDEFADAVEVPELRDVAAALVDVLDLLAAGDADQARERLGRLEVDASLVALRRDAQRPPDL